MTDVKTFHHMVPVGTQPISSSGIALILLGLFPYFVLGVLYHHGFFDPKPEVKPYYGLFSFGKGGFTPENVLKGLLYFSFFFIGLATVSTILSVLNSWCYDFPKAFQTTYENQTGISTELKETITAAVEVLSKQNAETSSKLFSNLLAHLLSAKSDISIAALEELAKTGVSQDAYDLAMQIGDLII